LDAPRCERVDEAEVQRDVRARLIVDRHIALLDEAMEAPADVEPLRRRL
jgi:hypothetical protein